MKKQYTYKFGKVELPERRKLVSLCERCGEEVNANTVNLHLHGYPYVMTYMPGVEAKKLINQD